ncbi:MAG TPA: cyclic-di-AMP receptor [Candidatus Ornithospirochaeta avicola]|uniref:Cyclic-di-AMP receptor n=1 Tax=Candidatus Ornithospirochaeta avicola TaxID=2840896 RepID=A0A9D1PSW7_9SPIO|nr:cyclic-di-AMP receptor [Candidatus Ornithospirochaeta avicola]
MKMIISILSQSDEENTVHALNEKGYYVTKLATMGGFLRKTNTTILIGCDDEKVEEAVSIIKKYSARRTENVPYMPPTGTAVASGVSVPFVSVPQTVGGSTVFVVDVTHFEKF